MAKVTDSLSKLVSLWHRASKTLMQPSRGPNSKGDDVRSQGRRKQEGEAPGWQGGPSSRK